MAKQKSEPFTPEAVMQGEQQHFPGMEPEKNERVHSLALKYGEARSKAVEARENMNNCKANLIAAMWEEFGEVGVNEIKYTWDTLEVEVSRIDKVKMKIGDQSEVKAD